MRMFDFQVHRFLIIGVVCLCYVLYLFTSSILLPTIIVIAICGALSAWRQRSSVLGLNSRQHYVPFARRRNVINMENTTPTDSIHSVSRQLTPISPWGVSKSNYRADLRNSPLQNAGKNTSRGSCGFASQVVSISSHYPPVDQLRYRGVGLFPTIHLEKSPLPILSEKNSKMIHNPVTVRIAPPDKSPTPSPRLDFVFNNTVQRSTSSSVNSVLKSLQQIQRKRSSSKMADEFEESQMKRQRREGSLSLTPSPGNVLNGMQHHAPPSIHLVSQGSSQESSCSASHKLKNFKNNEIYSSYSSANRRKEGMKRRRFERSESPSIKISRLHNSRSTVFGSPKEDTYRSNNHQRKPSSERFSPVLLPEDDIDQTESESETQQSRVSTSSPIVWREGFSRKRQLALYTSLRQPNCLSGSVPQFNSSVEDDHRDQLTNQARLHKLLTAFQAKDGDHLTAEKSGTKLFENRPLQISLGTQMSVPSPSAASSDLLTIATTPLPDPQTKPSPVTEATWVPRLDTTTTTTSLTTISSTGVGRPEVEKIHVQRSLFSPVTSTAASPRFSSTGTTSTPSTTNSPASLSPLVTAAFVSMPLTTSDVTFTQLKSFAETPTLQTMAVSTNSAVSTAPSNFTSEMKTTQMPSSFIFGQPLPRVTSKGDSGDRSRSLFNNTPATRAPFATASSVATLDSVKPAGNGFQIPASTTAGFNFNFNSAVPNPVLASTVSFGSTPSTGSVFNTSTPSVFNFGATQQNGPAVSTSLGTGAAAATTMAAEASANSFAFGQSGGFIFNFSPDPSGLNNRKAIQARRRTSRQH